MRHRGYTYTPHPEPEFTPVAGPSDDIWSEIWIISHVVECPDGSEIIADYDSSRCMTFDAFSRWVDLDRPNRHDIGVDRPLTLEDLTRLEELIASLNIDRRNTDLLRVMSRLCTP